jgi:hypothetical protein
VQSGGGGGGGGGGAGAPPAPPPPPSGSPSSSRASRSLAALKTQEEVGHALRSGHLDKKKIKKLVG